MPHDRFKACIHACNDCAVACDHCAVACLNEQDVTMLARCIALDVDCAEICRLAVGTMARGSECAATVCEACADVCDECARECDRHSKMEHCRECAQACRRCAQECRRMVAAHPGGARPGQGAGMPAH